MNGNTTLNHLITIRLQADKHEGIDALRYRNALKKLRQCNELCTYFEQLPKAMQTLGIDISADLSTEWETISASHIKCETSAIIEQIYTPNLHATFFVTLCTYTLIWQQTQLLQEIQAARDIDVKRYLLMKQLRYLEQLLQINQEQCSDTEDLVRGSYTLLIAHTWSLLCLYYPQLYQAEHLSYSQPEMDHSLHKPDLAPQLLQLAENLNASRIQITQDALKKNHAPPPAEEEKTDTEGVYITAKEAAAILDRDSSSVHRLFREKELKHRKRDERHKNKFLYLQSEIEQYAKQKNKNND